MVKENYHIHSTYSDGKATILEYAKEAVNKGFEEIAFTEHLAIRSGSLAKKLYYSMDVSKLGDYVEEARRVQEDFPNLKIRAGLEVDYFPGSESILRDILGSYDLDFTMLSVHWIGELCLDCSKYRRAFEVAVREEGFDKFYAKYLELLEKAVETGIFKAVAHFDVAKNWGFTPSKDFTREELRILEKVKDLGMAVEVSSKGLRNPIREPYPTRKILEACILMGIPIILGTDAHNLGELDSNIEPIISYAKSVGYSKVAIFDKGRIFYSPL
ncbi:MAG: histidinol-phosphatase [Nitrososphaerota archaeon]|nr:histidinol-phosphatase [Nitrososphaerota archaeon]